MNASANAGSASSEPFVFQPWMRRVLQCAAGYNMLAGFCLVVFVHEGYKLLRLEKPALVLPIQLVGVLVALFGLGYLLVSRDPVTNRNLLLLGSLSKLLGPALASYYIIVGKLPPIFWWVLLVSDLIYLPPFAVILRRLFRFAAKRRSF